MPPPRTAEQPAAMENKTSESSGNSAAQVPATPVSQSNVASLQPKELPLATANQQVTTPSRDISAAQNVSTTPAPKGAAFTGEPKTLDVASAIKKIVSPGTGITASSASAKTDAPAALVVEHLSPTIDA